MIRRRNASQAYDDDDDYGKSYYGKRMSHGMKPNGFGRPSSSRVPPWLIALALCLVIGAGVHRHRQKSSDGKRRRDQHKPEQQLLHRATDEQKRDAQKPPEGATATKDRHGDPSATKSLLTPEEDERLERDADGARYHLVFSTDCTPYQRWQSYLLFYTAMKARQPGHVTRIASGCSDGGGGEQDAREEEEWFRTHVAGMSRRFHLHLTPRFSGLADADGNPAGDYKYFNKPRGLLHWMENSPQLLFDAASGKFPASVEDDVVILVDPDMGLLRPITGDFGDDRETILAPAARRNPDKIVTRKVQRGKPVAQVYGYGSQWSRLDLEKIVGAGTPAARLSAEDARVYYPAGPPYLATVSDMHAIATHWSRFAPGVHEQYPHLLAEMFAYSLAAAHLQMPHQLLSSLMVSDVASRAEGWPLVDKIPVGQVCEFASHVNHTQFAVPSVVHYCQRHAVGSEWFFSKRKVPLDVFGCESPLWEQPPPGLAAAHDYHQFPGGTKKQLTKKQASYSSFVLCYLYSTLNEAGEFYKRNGCPQSSKAATNWERTRNLARMATKRKT